VQSYKTYANLHQLRFNLNSFIGYLKTVFQPQRFIRHRIRFWNDHAWWLGKDF